MSTVTKSLCWAVVLILLAAANAIGLITDQNANTMFAVIPALWVATTFGGTCFRKRAA
ncbi:MAG: hypothetical protein ABIT10_00435 [Alteraurantiacibacter sp.]